MDKYRKMLNGKIHRAVVTHANVDYEGSISVPVELLSAADIKPYQAVNVWNVTTGSRFETYAIEGSPDSGEISVNGAAAHLASPGDLVIIAAFADIHESELAHFTPRVVFVDSNNQIVGMGKEIPGPLLRSKAVNY